MPPNPVVFQFHGEPWRLVSVCLLSSLVLFVFWLYWLFRMLRLYGQGQKLSAAEASRVGSHPADAAYSTNTSDNVVRGAAVGKEWNLEYSIETLREAWQAKDYEKFVSLPLLHVLAVSAFGLCFFGIGVGARTWLLFGVTSPLLLLIGGVPVFMMWAAVFTKLK
jgi:hypothetical protein